MRKLYHSTIFTSLAVFAVAMFDAICLIPSGFVSSTVNLYNLVVEFMRSFSGSMVSGYNAFTEHLAAQAVMRKFKSQGYVLNARHFTPNRYSARSI